MTMLTSVGFWVWVVVEEWRLTHCLSLVILRIHFCSLRQLHSSTGFHPNASLTEFGCEKLVVNCYISCVWSRYCYTGRRTESCGLLWKLNEGVWTTGWMTENCLIVVLLSVHKSSGQDADQVVRVRIMDDVVWLQKQQVDFKREYGRRSRGYKDKAQIDVIPKVDVKENR